jgi:hypothetical protein
MSGVPMFWLGAIALSALFAWLERGAWRRLAAAALPLLVAALALPPRVPGRVDSAQTLPADADRVTVETAARSVELGGTITVTGDGLHPDFWPLLAGRRIEWVAPEPRTGLAALSWPRRAWLGEPVVIRGTIADGDSLDVSLTGPAGERDSVRTTGAFALTVVPRATGEAAWSIAVGGGPPDTLGVEVREPPRLRVVIVAARPDFELPALARRLEAQGAALVLQTRLTASEVRTVRYGDAPAGDPLAGEVLAGLDLLVLGDGAEATLPGAVRARIAAAVGDGLGVVQMVGATRNRSALFPFDAVPLRDVEQHAAVRLDSVRLPGNIPVAAVRLDGGVVLATDADGVPVAKRVAVGRGRVVATRLVAPSRWSLAGHPEAEAAWWARVAGAAVRQPTGQWRVSDSALIRVDEPLRLQWVGDTAGITALVEGDVTDTVPWATADSLGGAVVLWPRVAGWFTLIRAADTLRLMVGDPTDHEAVAMAARRRAAEAAAAAPVGEGPPADPLPRDLPRWPFALALLGAAAVVWRRG